MNGPRKSSLIDRLIQMFRRNERRFTLLYLAALSVLLLACGVLLVSRPARSIVDGAISQHTQQKLESWSNRFEHANQLVKSGAHDEAEQAFAALIDDIPLKRRGIAPARIRQNAMHALGHLYLDTGNASAAMHTFKRAVDANPGSPHDLYLYGHALFEASRDVDARTAMQACIALDPNHVQAVTALAESYTRTGEFEEAMQVYRAYLDAFAMAKATPWSEDFGVMFMNGDEWLATWRLAPVIDGRTHRYRIPVSRNPAFKDAGPIDLIVLRFAVIHTGGRMHLDRLTLWGEVDQRDGQRPKLLEIKDWTKAQRSGLEPIAGETAYRVASTDFSIQQPLSTPIDSKVVDEIEVVCRMEKPQEREIRARLETLATQVSSSASAE